MNWQRHFQPQIRWPVQHARTTTQDIHRCRILSSKTPASGGLHDTHVLPKTQANCSANRMSLQTYKSIACTDTTQGCNRPVWYFQNRPYRLQDKHMVELYFKRFYAPRKASLVPYISATFEIFGRACNSGSLRFQSIWAEKEIGIIEGHGMEYHRGVRSGFHRAITHQFTRRYHCYTIIHFMG